MSDISTSSYEQINDRLKEIASLVGDDSIALDDALDLFEEAVRLGVRASALIEDDIVAHNAQLDGESEAARAGLETIDGAEDGTEE